MNLVRGSIVFTAAQLVLLVVGLVSSIVISRSLGPDGRGVVALVTVVMTTATALATFGLGSAYAYLAGKRAHAYDQLVGSIVVMATALGVVTSALLLVFSDALLDSILRGMSTLQFGVTVASIPFVYLTFFLVNLLIGAGRAEEAAWMQLAAGIFTSAAVILALVVADQDVTGVIVVTVVATALVAGAYLVVVARRYGLSLGGMRVVGAASATYGAKAYPGTLSSHFWLRADFLILNYYSGPTAVGQYSLATNLAEQVWILDSSVSQVVLHDVISSTPGEAGRLVAKTSRNVVFLAGVICVILGALAPWLIPFLFGDEFRSAVVPLWLLFPGILAIAAARPISSYFSGQQGRPQITSAVSIATAVVGIGAYFVLIPPFGASGAAIGSSLAYVLPLVAYIPLFGRSTGISARDTFLLTRDDLRMYAQLLQAAFGRVRPAAGPSHPE